MLREINGKKLIHIVLDECKKTELHIVVAIPEDDVRLASYIDAHVFLGSENDVIDRYYNCAKEWEIDPIIRVCGDSKNIHKDLILQQLENFKRYRHTVYGNYCEVFTFKELEWYFLNDKRPQTREHVSLGMIQDMTVDYGIDLI